MKRGWPAEHGVEELALLAAEGDDDAFSRLASRLRPRMYRWALVQLEDADAAEDVTQRALLRMRNALPGFRRDAAFTTWMYTIVRSATADWRRSERRRDAMHAKQAPPTEPATPTPANDTDGSSGLVEIVRGHMRDLPGRQREVFDLVDLQGRTALEAAALLSLNPATTRVHLMRARRTIRARLIERNAALVEDRI